MARTLASLAAYVATADGAGVQIHQYAPARIATALDGGRRVGIEVATGYPGDGAVHHSGDGRGLVLGVPGGGEEAVAAAVGDDPQGGGHGERHDGQQRRQPGPRDPRERGRDRDEEDRAADPTSPHGEVRLVTADEQGSFSRVVFALGPDRSYRAEPEAAGLRVVVPGAVARVTAPIARLAPRAIQLRLTERAFRS